MNRCILPSDKKRTMLVRATDTTNPKFGKKPDERSVDELIRNGVINLDKPRGPTSHEVVAWVKRILNLNKAGHSGTLDPGVSGVLPVALENATRILSALLISGKEYIGILHLHSKVPPKKIKQAFKLFEGPIYQRPPLKSSVKRTLRIRQIYCLDVLEIDEKDVLFRVGCQAGTYIRKLCHDIGLVLGVGGHMSELRRIRSGPFSENENLVTLHQLSEAFYIWINEQDDTLLRKTILPLEYALQHLPKIIVRDSAVDAICHGADLAAPGVLQLSSGIKLNDLVAIFTLKGEAVALARAKMTSMQMLKANKGIVADTERVLMERETYPPWYFFKDYSAK